MQQLVIKVNHFKAVTVDLSIKNTVKPKVMCRLSVKAFHAGGILLRMVDLLIVFLLTLYYFTFECTRGGSKATVS